MKFGAYLIFLIPILWFNTPKETIDCEKIRQETPQFLQVKDGIRDSLLAQDMEIIASCMNWDETDKKIMNDPLVGGMIIQLSQRMETVTYGTIMDTIQKYQALPAYHTARSAYEFVSVYENKVVNKADSLPIRYGFQSMGYSGNELDYLMNFTYDPRYSGMTYRQILDEFIRIRRMQHLENGEHH